jgi:hypothetical protein
MTGWAKGYQQLERRRSRLTMVYGQHGMDRAGLAAAATMLVPGEHLFAEPGEVLPVGPLPVVATLAVATDIDRGRTAAAEKHPLPRTGEPGGPNHFPSLPETVGREVDGMFREDIRTL